MTRITLGSVGSGGSEGRGGSGVPGGDLWTCASTPSFCCSDKGPAGYEAAVSCCIGGKDFSLSGSGSLISPSFSCHSWAAAC